MILFSPWGVQPLYDTLFSPEGKFDGFVPMQILCVPACQCLLVALAKPLTWPPALYQCIRFGDERVKKIYEKWDFDKKCQLCVRAVFALVLLRESLEWLMTGQW